MIRSWDSLMTKRLTAVALYRMGYVVRNIYLIYTQSVSGVCFQEQTEGNPVRIRNCPAAVNRNENSKLALVTLLGLGSWSE